MMEHITPDIAAAGLIALIAIWRKGTMWGFPYPMGRPNGFKVILIAAVAVVATIELKEVDYVFTSLAVATSLGSLALSGWTKMSRYA